MVGVDLASCRGYQEVVSVIHVNVKHDRRVGELRRATCLATSTNFRGNSREMLLHLSAKYQLKFGIRNGTRALGEAAAPALEEEIEPDTDQRRKPRK